MVTLIKDYTVSRYNTNLVNFPTEYGIRVAKSSQSGKPSSKFLRKFQLIVLVFLLISYKIMSWYFKWLWKRQDYTKYCATKILCQVLGNVCFLKQLTGECDFRQEIYISFLSNMVKARVISRTQNTNNLPNSFNMLITGKNLPKIPSRCYTQ